jgi:altronate dehydratase
MIVILGTTSSTASYARALAERLQAETAVFPHIDGLVPIAHTEGAGYAQINNRDYLLRVLAGLMVHPNVTAVLAADTATDPITNQTLLDYLRQHNYPLDDVWHHFFSLSGDWQADLDAGAAIVKQWLPQANELRRQPAPLSDLTIALQCGGSDAFSGVSGNPLAASVAREVIRAGGRANLAETDELIGAEAYMLQNVRDEATARTFLQTIAQFKERLAWHGVTAEGNPSGGNRYRGLYNIALKSIGAAMKRHPEVCLDYVVDYGERMNTPGFYFMNSPGNDLESIAGQVAGGSNLIIFVTGNGSITNFPFVPTIKVMTTTHRYEMLAQEMDVNAGAYLDGVPMAELTAESLDLLIAIASGQRSKGELAGHSQISIWRNWQQTDGQRLPIILERRKPDGRCIKIETKDYPLSISSLQKRSDPVSSLPQIGLILPTSLCAGQIARLAAAKLNEMNWGEQPSFSQFVALVHTEGCGVAFASARDIYADTMPGYALHPLVGACLFLEHGCEKTHNDYLRSLLRDRGLDLAQFGWASVQLDGGIARVMQKIIGYFRVASDGGAKETDGQITTFGLLVDGAVSDALALSLARVVQRVVGAGTTAVIPDNSSLWQTAVFLQTLDLEQKPSASLAYGQAPTEIGFHVMETPTPHWTETMTGLGAAGVQVMVACADLPRPRHPFVPVVMVGDGRSAPFNDLTLTGDSSHWPAQILQVAADAQQQLRLPQNNTDFQLTRGWLGIST